jgi:hypothetical protein
MMMQNVNRPPCKEFVVILSSWKYFKDGEGEDVSVYAMKACGGVELQLRSFLTPIQCNIEVKVQICYPVVLHVRKETPVPIEKEVGVQGGVAGVGASGVAVMGNSFEMVTNLAAKLIF